MIEIYTCYLVVKNMVYWIFGFFFFFFMGGNF